MLWFLLLNAEVYAFVFPPNRMHIMNNHIVNNAYNIINAYSGLTALAIVGVSSAIIV
jgi:hypothetical protein